MAMSNIAASIAHMAAVLPIERASVGSPGAGVEWPDLIDEPYTAGERTSKIA
jgi:hypothetical protein